MIALHSLVLHDNETWRVIGKTFLEEPRFDLLRVNTEGKQQLLNNIPAGVLEEVEAK